MPVKNNQRPDRGANKKAGNAPAKTPEQQRAKLAKDLGLTIRQQNFVDELIKDKRLSATEAYIRVYGEPKDRQQASVNASRLLSNDKVVIYKASHVSKALRRIVQLVGSDNESIALKASQDILDREKGKAVQKSENVSRTVEVKLDLTGVRIGAHYLNPSQLPDPMSQKV